MISMAGKTGLVFGIANDRSIAAAISKACHDAGAELAFTHLPDSDPDRPKARNRLMKVVGDFDPKVVMPCDVTDDAALDAVFDAVKKEHGKLDFVLHSIAFASLDDLKRPAYKSSRGGFKTAMEISAYSLFSLAQRAEPLMTGSDGTGGGSLLALTYIGGERVIPGYNMMGVCKAALECCVKYAASELGPKGIRVNAVSAGPLRTLAASAVGDFSAMSKLYETFSPLRRNITAEEVGAAGAFLLSDAAAGITGENLHVDAGFHAVAAPPGDHAA